MENRSGKHMNFNIEIVCDTTRTFHFRFKCLSISRLIIKSSYNLLINLISSIWMPISTLYIYAFIYSSIRYHIAGDLEVK